MIKIDDECVDCGLPCMGKNCPCKDVIHIICDECGDECREVYDVDGEHLCENCLLETFPVINEDNAREMI